MGRFLPRYKPFHKPISVVGKEAYHEYKNTSTVRDPKIFNYYTDYRRITRKIWKKIADSSLEYDSGVYVEDFFYLIPQVVDNMPFIELPNGKIKTNSHTDGDVYSPIFCNLLKSFDLFCWSFDGCHMTKYKQKLSEIIDEYIPKYYFILPILLKNKIK